MSRFRLSKQAKTDLDSIWDHIGIAKNNPEAARRQLEMLYDKFILLASQPLLGQSCEKFSRDCRMFSAGSYVIFYRPMKTRIEIQRVLHGSRDIDALISG